MNVLADELLRLIVGPFFDVPEEHFAHNGSISPFSKVPQSVAELLRVCKRWMRFATPLLYSTVVIRTKAQAAALSMALTNNAEFGLYVRRLRLEGVYGEFVTPDLIKTMPNVRQMCFPINMLARDDTDGLLSAFELFELERVVLLSMPRYRHLVNGTMTEFVTNLANVIPTWDNLKHFTFPESNAPQDTNAIKTLGPALHLVPNLKTVTICRGVIMSTFGVQPATETCFDLLQMPGLEHFIVQGLEQVHPRTARQVFAHLPANVRSRVRAVKNAFCGTSFADRMVKRPANQFWLPMFSLSDEERLRIWTKILGFALQREVDALDLSQRSWWDHKWMYQPHEMFDMVTGGACLRVSKEFNLATHRVLEAHILTNTAPLYGLRSTTTYERRLFLDPNLPSYVRSLQIQWGYNTGNFPTSVELQSMAFDRMTALDQVVLLRCTEHGLRALWPVLRQASGFNLVRLAIVYSGPAIDVQEDALIGGLGNLRELYLITHNLTIQADATLTQGNHLPQLEVLHMSDAKPCLHAAITRQNLPSLRTVLFQRSAEALTFLVKHGAKITHLGLVDKMYTEDVLNAVPNLTTLTIREPSTQRCLATLNHSNVSLIYLDWSLYGAGKFKVLVDYMARKIEDGEWPALRRISVMKHTPDGLWPVDERSAKRSPWPKMAKLLASVGVALTDRSGREWRERLQWTDDVVVDDGKEDHLLRVTRLRSGMKESAETPELDETATASAEEEEEAQAPEVAGSSSRLIRSRKKARTSSVQAEAPAVSSSLRRSAMKKKVPSKR